MDLHYKQEVTVGTLVLVGAALFIWGTMWLGGRSFSREPTVAIAFSDAGARLAGQNLGRAARHRAGDRLPGLREGADPHRSRSAREAPARRRGGTREHRSGGRRGDPLH